MERIATITTIGDDFNTLNLTIDPPVLKLTTCYGSGSGGSVPVRVAINSECETLVLDNPTMENGSLVYSDGQYLYYVRYENGVPSYVESEYNNGLSK